MTLSKVEVNPEYQERCCVREPIKINYYVSSFIAAIADPSSTQDTTHMNLVNGLARHESPRARSVVKHPTDVRTTVGSIPLGDSDFFFSPLT